MQNLIPAYSESQGQSIIEQLKAEGWTDQDIKEMMEIAAMQAQIPQGDSDIEAAREMQQQPGPEGRFTGRAYTKANPMEHLAHTINTVRGHWDEKQARERQQKLREDIMNRRMGALNRMGRSAQPQPAPGQAMNQQQANAKQLFPMSGFQWMKA